MDWLEVISTTMQDLSDGSAEWWTRVRALADEAYKKWTNASPVEKLSIEPPKEAELETGRWGRVNSRGASMIMLAIPVSEARNGSTEIYGVSAFIGLPLVDDVPARRAKGEGDDLTEPPAAGGGKLSSEGGEVIANLGEVVEEM